MRRAITGTNELEIPVSDTNQQSLKSHPESSSLFEIHPGPDTLHCENIVVVIPAYNEERFIGSVALKACHYARTVIVVDDGSTDCTAEIAAESKALVVRHPKNLGKGAAMATGFSEALKYDPEVIVTLDGDGQHLPEELDIVARPILAGEADIVVGSRYLDQVNHVPRHRIWGHWIFNRLTQLSSGVKASDSQSGFRAFSQEAAKKIDFHSSGFSVESEMQFIAREAGLRLVEVPITIRYTDPPKRSVIAHGLFVLNGILRLVGQYRPLFFFAVPGTAILAFGIILGIAVIDIYTRGQTLAVGYAMISVQLSIVGTLLISTGIILHSVRGLLIEFLSHSKK